MLCFFTVAFMFAAGFWRIKEVYIRIVKCT